MKLFTGRANYRRLGERLGVDLEGSPELALQPYLAAEILKAGMGEGLFTGKCLSDYFKAGADNPVGARRVVNGADRAAEIAGYYHRFLAAMRS